MRRFEPSLRAIDAAYIEDQPLSPERLAEIMAEERRRQPPAADYVREAVPVPEAREGRQGLAQRLWLTLVLVYGACAFMLGLAVVLVKVLYA